MFVPTSQLAFLAEKLKSQKYEQIANSSTDYCNAEKQTSEEMT
jgi:hypothetical protein